MKSQFLELKNLKSSNMKQTIKQIVPMLLLLTIVAVSGCKKESVSGTTWTVNYSWKSGDTGYGTITFSPDKTLGIYGYSGVSSWSQSGSSVSWSFSGYTTSGKPTVATYRGTISGSRMTGTQSNSYGDSGTFTATK